MDDSEQGLSQEGSKAEDVLESVGMGQDSAEESGDSEAKDSANKDDPYGVKKRLGMQAKKHQRELRAMQEQLMQMQSQLGQSNQQQSSSAMNQQANGSGNGQMSDDERIQSAVRYALQAREAEAQKARDAERQAHVQKQYQRLHQEFDKASDKYEDFDDVVRGEDVPFTPAIRDALLLVDNPADVAYKLGKNRDELTKISQLHPVDQAREVNKLAFALMGGSNGNKSGPQKSQPMGASRPNPVNNAGAVTDKTPPSAIRARMKAGTWR